MASLVPSYEYDIFISYRHKDNKYDGWVTEFVANLKKEIEATFKEDISIYFDVNPHDGLLETHDVDDSLKDKLKCLIFIPIISRTYCDAKSFAWTHEFLAFLKTAAIDSMGLKVKLPNGNTASRVLPIRIHELDVSDKALFVLLMILPLRVRFHTRYQKTLKCIFYITNGIGLAANVADSVYYRFSLRRTTMTLLRQFENETNLGALSLEFLIDYWYAVLFWAALMYILVHFFKRVSVEGPQLKN